MDIFCSIYSKRLQKYYINFITRVIHDGTSSYVSYIPVPFAICGLWKWQQHHIWILLIGLFVHLQDNRTCNTGPTSNTLNSWILEKMQQLKRLKYEKYPINNTSVSSSVYPLFVLILKIDKKIFLSLTNLTTFNKVTIDIRSNTGRTNHPTNQKKTRTQLTIENNTRKLQ